MFLVYFCQNKKEYIYQHVQLFQRIPPKKKNLNLPQSVNCIYSVINLSLVISSLYFANFTK